MPDPGLPAAAEPQVQSPPPAREGGNAAGAKAGTRSIAAARTAPLRGWFVRIWPAVAFPTAAFLGSLLDLEGSAAIQPGLAQALAALSRGIVDSGAAPAGGSSLSEAASLPRDPTVNPGGGFFEPSHTEISLLLLAGAAAAILLLALPRRWFPHRLRRLPDQLRRF
jgi:hypothetical protein